MFYEVKCVAKELSDAMDKPDWLESFGNYNNWPKPVKKISMSEFYSEQIYPVEYLEHRQIIDDTEGYMNATVYWYWNAAYIVVSPGHKKRPQYFRVGCDHNFEEYKCEGFMHFTTCSKCGLGHVYDSSG